MCQQVPFSCFSFNHDDVFVLNITSKKFQFNGANSSIQERGKALEVMQHIKDIDHEGKCEIIIVSTHRDQCSEVIFMSASISFESFDGLIFLWYYIFPKFGYLPRCLPIFSRSWTIHCFDKPSFALSNQVTRLFTFSTINCR